MLKNWFGGGRSSKLIEAAYDDFSTMLKQSAKMLDAAMGYVFEDKQPETNLDEMDDVVDDSERMIRRTILQHLSVNPQQDLVASLILVSMVQDAERVGDFARGLAEVRDLARHPVKGPFADELRQMAREVHDSFEACERAFVEDKTELAEDVIRKHIDFKAKLQEFTQRVAGSDLTADMAIFYASSARILRRISAHLSNIASSVVQPFDKMRHGDEQV